MIKTCFTIICVLLNLIFLLSNTFCQQHYRFEIPIDVSIGSNCYSASYQNESKKFPVSAISFGTNFQFYENNGFERFQELHAGIIYDKNNTQSIFLDTEFIFRYNTSFRLFISGGFAIGYILNIFTNVSYINNEGFEKDVNLKRKSFLMLGMPASVGISLKNKNNTDFDIFARILPFVQVANNTKLPKIQQYIIFLGTGFTI